MSGMPAASGAPKVSGAPGIPGVVSPSGAPQASGAPPVAGLPSVVGQPSKAPQASGAPAVVPSQAASAQLAGSASTLLPAVVSAVSGSPNANPTIGGTVPQTLPALGAPGLPVNAPPIPLMGGGLGPWGFFGPWGGVNNAPFKGPWKRSSPKMMRRQDLPALPTVVGASSAAIAATSFPAVAASEISAGAREPTPGVPAANSMATIAPPVASAPAASVPSAGAPAASASAGVVPAAPPVVSPVPIASQAPGPNASSSAKVSISASASNSGAKPPIVPAKTSSGAPAASASPAIAPPGSVKEVTVQFPINRAVLLKILGKLPDTPNNGNGAIGESPADITDEQLRSIQFQVARRDVGADNARFTPFSANNGNSNAGGATNGMKLTISNGNLMFSGGTQLDGEYVVLIPAATTPQALAQAQKGAKNAAGAKRVDSGHLVALAIVIFAALMV
jgi:hypothetical protein